MNVRFSAGQVNFVNVEETLKQAQNVAKIAANIMNTKAEAARQKPEFDKFQDSDKVSFSVMFHPTDIENDKIEVQVGDIKQEVKREREGGHDTWGEFCTYPIENDKFLLKAIQAAKTLLAALAPLAKQD
jgi:hypothetical protein